MRNSSFWLIHFIFVLVSYGGFAQEIDYNLDKHKMLIENKGQWDNQILFQSSFQGGNLWVQQHKLLFHLQDYSAYQAAHANFRKTVPNSTAFRQSVIHANFVGSNEVKEIQKERPSRHYYNYFLGNDASKWASDVHSFHKVKLIDLYNGIDLQIIQTNDELKYEFHVAPNADADQIQIQYAGQKSLKIDREGNLNIESDLGMVTEKKSYVYQIINGKVIVVSSQFKLEKDQLHFILGSYNKAFELVIDPILVFATYCGSVTDNFGMTGTYAHDGSAYSGGTIYGNLYPINPDSLAFGIASNFTVANVSNSITTDVFITKYSSDGTNLIWTNFLGGGDDVAGTETVHSLIADAQDNLYCYGATSSLDFPTSTNAAQGNHAGGVSGLNVTFNGVQFGNVGTDIFVSKISANGQVLMGSTYIGGSGNDGVNYNPSSLPYNSIAAYNALTTNYGDQFRGEVMLDSIGNCIVATSTRSIDFPVLNAFQTTNGGNQDGVIFKLNTNLSSLLWSSYYGGANNDACYSVKVDSSQNIVFAGGTTSSNLPNTNGWQTAYNGGSADGFVAKISTNGQTFLAASYIGTANYDQTFMVEIDRTNKIFLVGQSIGGSFPVINSSYSNPGSSQYIIKLSSDLTTVLNSTVFGNGSPQINISPSAFLVDKCGSIYVSGWGANILQSVPLTGMPVTSNALMSNPPNGFDFYLFVMDRLFASQIYGSYIGGNQAEEHVDGGTSRFDRNGVVYQSVCGGCQGYSDFPTTPGAWSNSNLSTNCNNLIFKFDFQTQTVADFVVSDTSTCLNEPIILTNNSSSSPYETYYWDLGNGDTSTLFNPTLTFNNPGNYTVYLIVTDSVCSQTDTAQININIAPELPLFVTNDTVICQASSFDLIANSSGLANYFIWSSNSSFTDTLNDNILDSILTINPLGSQIFYVKIGNGVCSKTDSVQVLILSNSLLLSDTLSYCEGESKNISVTNLVPSLNFSYQWSPTSIIVGPSDQATVSINTLINQYLYLEVTDGLGCTLEDSVWLDIHLIGSVIVSASANPALIPSGTISVLIAEPAGAIYSWSPTTGLSNPNAQITEAIVTKDTEFTVLVGDGVCFNSAKVKVQVYEYVCDNPFIFVPNAFSPNGDGENDVLYVRGAILERILFRVFNRWGEMVFESSDKDYGWDGTFKGKMMDPDTYDYYLKAVCIDKQEKIIKGNVTLMR
jgi:gliding motility-associated-like protein